MKYEEVVFPREWEGKEPEMVAGVVAGVGGSIDSPAGSGVGAGVVVGVEMATPSDAALGALLEEAAAEEDDAERRVQRLGSQVARLDALNVAGMLAAATESGGAGATLAARLDAGLRGGAALQARLRRCAALAQGAPDAVHARSGAARAEANARALLDHLDDLYRWLDAPPLRDLDSLPEVSLGGAEGRARALAAALALQRALRAERRAPPHLRRLAAVRERLRRLARAKDQVAGAWARHLNNALIHLGNEAAHEARPSRHHADLAPYAPFMRWLKDMDEKAFDALAKVYCSTWSRVYERSVRGACEAARGALAPPGAPHAGPGAPHAGPGPAPAPPGGCDAPLDQVLELVEGLCNAEQDFCTQFFCLDLDLKRGDARAGVRGAARAERGRGWWWWWGWGRRGAVGARGAGGGGGGGQARRGPRGGGARGGAGRGREAGGAPAQVRRVPVHPRAGGAERGVRGHLPGGRAARRPRPLVPGAGHGHGARHPPGGAPAHAAPRGAHGELPPAARRRVGAARARAGAAAARVPRAVRRRAQGLRDAVLRAAAGEADAVLRGRVGGGGHGRARGGGVLPRRVQQARAAARAGALPARRGAPRAAPPLPHRRQAPQRRGRPAAGRLATHAGGVHRAARAAAGADRGVLPGRRPRAAALHAGHPRSLLRHRQRTLSTCSVTGHLSML